MKFIVLRLAWPVRTVGAAFLRAHAPRQLIRAQTSGASGGHAHLPVAKASSTSSFRRSPRVCLFSAPGTSTPSVSSHNSHTVQCRSFLLPKLHGLNTAARLDGGSH